MQLDVKNKEPKELAETSGLSVVMNRCPKIEFSRLYGELGLQGLMIHTLSVARNDQSTTRTENSPMWILIYRYLINLKRNRFMQVHPHVQQLEHVRLPFIKRPHMCLTALMEPLSCSIYKLLEILIRDLQIQPQVSSNSVSHFWKVVDEPLVQVVDMLLNCLPCFRYYRPETSLLEVTNSMVAV